MADRKQLNLLKKDVDAWNQWRDENPDIVPDLSGADLANTDLNVANLAAAGLKSANLVMTNLCGADLRGADLRDANLVGARMIGASERRPAGPGRLRIGRAAGGDHVDDQFVFAGVEQRNRSRPLRTKLAAAASGASRP